MKRVRLTITDADLAAYVDDEASLVPRADLDTHIEDTPEDRTKVEIWLQQRELLQLAFGRTIDEPVPLALSVTHPKPVRPEIQIGEDRDADPVKCVTPLRNKETKPASPSSVAQSVMSGVFLTGLVLGLIFVFKPTLLGDLSAIFHRFELSGPTSQNLDEISLQLARRASEAHRTFVAARSLAVTGSLNLADDPSLSLALTRLVGVAVRVPDFKTEGLQLVAVRVTPGDLGPSAFLLFQSPMGEDFGLLISRIVGSETSYPVYRDDRGTGTLAWTNGQGGYVLTGQSGSSRLTALRKAGGF